MTWTLRLRDFFIFLRHFSKGADYVAHCHALNEVVVFCTLFGTLPCVLGTRRFLQPELRQRDLSDRAEEFDVWRRLQPFPGLQGMALGDSFNQRLDNGALPTGVDI